MPTGTSTGTPVRTVHRMGRRPEGPGTLTERRPITGSLLTIVLLVVLGLGLGAALGAGLAAGVQALLDLIAQVLRP